MENPTFRIIPYTDYLYIEPIEAKQVMVSDNRRLERYGRVLAIGKEVVDTKVGDYIAFEMWDLKEFTTSDGKAYKFVSEREAICRLSM